MALGSLLNGFVQLAPELDDVDEGFDLASFDRLREIEDDHFWFTTRNEMIVWLVERFAAQGGRALEIGCGTGYVLFAFRRALSSARLAGSELHSLGLVHARQRHGQAIELVQMDARHIGLSGALDLVGAFDVLEHIADDHRVLDEFYRVLKPGGVLIATVPQHPSLWSAADEVAHHQRRYRIGGAGEQGPPCRFHDPLSVIFRCPHTASHGREPPAHSTIEPRQPDERPRMSKRRFLRISTRHSGWSCAANTCSAALVSLYLSAARRSLWLQSRIPSPPAQQFRSRYRP